jgi:NDP-sugar pyrophosphorylase family protein
VQLGPNVSIGAGAKVRAGTRIKNALVLDRSEVKVRVDISFVGSGLRS